MPNGSLNVFHRKMKKVLFLRHAKSSWEYAVADRHRPLQPKGMKAIAAVAQHWKKRFLAYDALYSSPANRAFHTAAILAHTIDFPLSKISLHEQLYSFNSNDIINFIQHCDDKIERLILVGHNPAFSQAANYFCVNSTPELKTADWISLTFEQALWQNIADGHGQYGSKKEAAH